MTHLALHPISYVSRQTGLPAHLIRTWESRYQAVKPSRSNANRRLYCEADIERLRTLAELVEAGHSISQVAKLSPAELVNLQKVDRIVKSAMNEAQAPAAVSAAHYRRVSFRSVTRLDAAGLELVLNEAAVNLTRPQVLFDLVAPLHGRILRAFRQGRLRCVHRSVANTVMRAFLWDMLRTVAVAESAPRLVVATPRCQRSEIGALILAVTAAESGWRPIYLGPDLPADDIAAAVNLYQVQAVALRFMQSNNAGNLEIEVDALRNGIPASVTVFICSNGRPDTCHDAHRGVITVPQLDRFRQSLEALPACLPN